MKAFTKIPAEKLIAFGEGVFRKAGVPKEDAKKVAEILVEADLKEEDVSLLRQLGWELGNPFPF